MDTRQWMKSSRFDRKSNSEPYGKAVTTWLSCRQIVVLLCSKNIFKDALSHIMHAIVFQTLLRLRENLHANYITLPTTEGQWTQLIKQIPQCSETRVFLALSKWCFTLLSCASEYI